MERIVNVIINFSAPFLTQITAEIRKLNAEMVNLRGNAANSKKGLRELGTEANKTSGKVNKATTSINKNNNALNNTAGSAKKATGAFANFGKQMGNTIAFLLRFAVAVAALKAVEFALLGPVRAAIQFEEALGSLQAIADVSNENMKRLSANILDVAGSTRFTATEIAELQKALARLGFSTEQIIASTEAVARFAEATGESSTQVAEFVGKQLKAFGLATIQVTELVNAYTTSINKSALTLETLATSSQYASSISNALGITFREQNALLATLADNGFRASRAGTGLRTILLELGAESGSLIPILDNLAESQLTLSEAEELVGKRAAGQLLVLVSQREAVKDLEDAQKSLTSTLIASARQNSTFTGQVDAMKAAIDKILISLGEWVTKTEAVLEIIEFLGGGTTLRGFDVLTQLGLSGDQLDTAIEKITSLENGFDSFINTTTVKVRTATGEAFKVFNTADYEAIAETLNLTQEEAIKLGDKLLEIRAKDIENLPAVSNLLIEMRQQQQKVNEVLGSAASETLKYQEALDELREAGEDSIGFEEKRDQLYKDITEVGLKNAREELKKYTNTLRPLTEDEVKRVSVLEAIISELQRQSNAVRELKSDEEDLGNTNKESLKTFDQLLSMQDALGKAIIEGDVAKQMSITTDLKKQKSLLVELDMLDDYEGYVKRIKALEEERRQRALSERGVDRQGTRAVAEGETRIRNFQEAVLMGSMTPNQAAQEIFEYLEKVGAKFGFDSKYYKDLQKQVFSFTDLIIDADTGSEDATAAKEKRNLIAQELAKLANFVNDQILDATQRRLDAEQAAVDARYSYEEDRLNGFLQAGIISAEQFERQRLRLEKERVAKTNELEKKRFNAEKANSISQIAINTAVAVSRVIGNPILAALIPFIIASGAFQAGLAASQQFQPVRFGKGGFIDGASHDQGGVPFTVQGKAGFEAEGGEFIVNKRATKAFLPTLERINEFGNGSIPAARNAFANGGVVPRGSGNEEGLLEELVRLSKNRVAYVSEEQLVERNNLRIKNDIRKRV